MEKIVKFKNVSKFYGTLKAIDHLNFEINKKEYVALIGNNGCGKTTTINLLCNLISYEEGEIVVFGKKVTKNYSDYKKRLGILLSKPYYIEEFTPVKYLEFIAKFQNIPRRSIRTRINDILELMEFENLNKRIEQLSSGNQMKVSIAAALIHNPELLILDEPFINLDISTTEKMMNLLKIFKGKKTLFITSHSLDLIADLCDRFLIMINGKIEIELNKKDFNNIESLKLRVKEILGSDNELKNIEWLS